MTGKLHVQRRAALVGGLAFCCRAPAANAIPIGISASADLSFAGQVLGVISQAAEIEWEIQSLPFFRLVRMVEEGQILGFGVARSPARELTMSFTNPVFFNNIWPVSRSNFESDFRSVSDLRNLTVCLARDAYYGPAVEEAAGRDFKAEYAGGDMNSRLKMLAAHRCDVLLAVHQNDDGMQLRRRMLQAGARDDELFIASRPLARQSSFIVAKRGGALERFIPILNGALASQRPRIAKLSQNVHE